MDSKKLKQLKVKKLIEMLQKESGKKVKFLKEEYPKKPGKISVNKQEAEDFLYHVHAELSGALSEFAEDLQLDIDVSQENELVKPLNEISNFFFQRKYGFHPDKL